MHYIGGHALPDYYEPADKSDAINDMLYAMTGGNRVNDIRSGMCVPRPIGCGEPIGPFRNALSAKEYTISGLCQTCQDSVFGID